VHDPLPPEFACSICGRAWSSGTDGKWPIRVTAADPPRAVAHCLTCAELGAGYDARGCAADLRPQPAAVHHRNGAATLRTPTPAGARFRIRLTRAEELRRIVNRWRTEHPEAQVELSD